tara:strand:- start:694 stop:1026 length:333 start_codon:yes stop_codon:yes gene_type:complete
MKFEFLEAEDVDSKMFRQCVKVILKQSPLQLHITNDLCLKRYKKNIVDFISYLIKIGEKLEEYEWCSKLTDQQKRYKLWIRINLDTINSISQLIKNTEENIKDDDNRKKH